VSLFAVGAERAIAQREGDVEAGFLASRDVAPDGSRRVRALGPFFERQTATNGAGFFSIRPFYCRVTDPARDSDLREYLWPVGLHKEFQDQSFWRVLLAYGADFDTTAPGSRYRASLFPLLYAGRDAQGEGYFAFFPLGGEIHEFIGRDTLGFALFPLYQYSTMDDLRTWSVLWPLISRTTGDDVHRFRVFPFYGISRNGDDWTKKFVLWPFWTSVRYDYPTASGGGFILFPLFGHTKLTDQETWMLLPPLFRWSRGEQGRKVLGPWPFVQYSSGETEKLYLWPLWGRRQTGGARSWFCLWPVAGGSEITRPGRSARTVRVLPVLQSHTERRWEAERSMLSDSGGAEPAAVVTNVTARYVKVWPLASYRREGSESRFRALDLSPFKNSAPIERNWAPFWTLYSQTRTPACEERELLWGLYRHRRETGGESRVSVFPLWSSWSDARPDGDGGWSVLKGLAGRRSENGRRRWQVLYLFTLGGRPGAPAPSLPPDAG
jgi:hypothetical protein